MNAALKQQPEKFLGRRKRAKYKMGGKISPEYIEAVRKQIEDAYYAGKVPVKP